MNTNSMKFWYLFVSFIFFAMVSPLLSHAIPIAVSGTYTGNINGVSLNGSSTGMFDNQGTGINTISVDFSSIPNNTFHPFSLASSIITIICWSAAETICPDTLNLFDLTGGNYDINRTFTWSTLPGDIITATGSASTTGSDLAYSMALSGSYSGPTDLVGVSGYKVNWTPDGTNLIEVGNALIETSGGSAFTVDIETVYSGLTTPLPLPQFGVFTSNSLTYVETGALTGEFDLDWSATLCVPEPTTMLLLGTGLIGFAGFRKKFKN